MTDVETRGATDDPPRTATAGKAASRASTRARLVRMQLAIVLLLIVVDQVTKLVVVRALALHETVTVIPNFFHFTHVLNTGGVFGVGGDLPGWARTAIFLALPFGIIGLAAYYSLLLPVAARWRQFTLALLIGGALGNLIDRVRLGVVVDFFLLRVDDWSWPAFNVADCAITVGIVVLLVSAFFENDEDEAVEGATRAT